MAKNRMIRTEIWTDDKFVSLSPLARLLFIGMWNHACDNGHLDDSALQLKMRVLPADNCDVAELLEEIIDTGMVTRVGDYLKVVNLSAMQSLDLRYLQFCDHCDDDRNAHYAREDKPTGKGRPRDTRTSGTRAAREKHTSPLSNGVVGGDVGGDGGSARASTRATRLDPDFVVTDEMRTWAKAKGLDHLDLDAVTEQFVDHWIGKSGKDATKTDWLATWRNWIRREDGFRGGSRPNNVAKIEPRKGMPPEPCSTCGAPPEHGHYDGCPVAS